MVFVRCLDVGMTRSVCHQPSTSMYSLDVALSAQEGGGGRQQRLDKQESGALSGPGRGLICQVGGEPRAGACARQSGWRAPDST